MKRRIIVGLAALVVIAGALAIWHLVQVAKEAGAIFVSGNIEVVDVELSFRVSGWIKSRPVDEGQSVEAGQLIANLDDTELVADLAQRKADVGVAAATLAALEAGSRPQEIAAAQALVDRNNAEVQRLVYDFQRVSELIKSDAASGDEYQSALWNLAAARAALAQAKDELSLAIEGPRKEDIDRARANLQQAKAAQEAARIRLDYATIPSPLSGMVLSKSSEPGEFVAPGTAVVTVADLYNVYLRAYVNESDLGRVKLGQSVDIATDSYPGKVYHGRISFISSQAEFTPKTVQTTKERVKLVYRIKIDVDNPRQELKPGMPADGRIILEPQMNADEHG